MNVKEHTYNMSLYFNFALFFKTKRDKRIRREELNKGGVWDTKRKDPSTKYKESVKTCRRFTLLYVLFSVTVENKTRE